MCFFPPHPFFISPLTFLFTFCLPSQSLMLSFSAFLKGHIWRGYFCPDDTASLFAASQMCSWLLNRRNCFFEVFQRRCFYLECSSLFFLSLMFNWLGSPGRGFHRGLFSFLGGIKVLGSEALYSQRAFLLFSAPVIPSICWWSPCSPMQKEDGIAFILEACFWDEQNSSVGGAFFWTSIYLA